MRWGVKCVLLPFRIIPPTSSLSGLRPQFTVGLPEEDRPTLKGGVNFKGVRASKIASREFFNSPLTGGKKKAPGKSC